MHLIPFPWAVVRVVKVFCGKGLSHSWVKHDDVGVAADQQGTRAEEAFLPLRIERDRRIRPARPGRGRPDEDHMNAQAQRPRPRARQVHNELACAASTAQGMRRLGERRAP